MDIEEQVMESDIGQTESQSNESSSESSSSFMDTFEAVLDGDDVSSKSESSMEENLDDSSSEEDSITEGSQESQESSKQEVDPDIADLPKSVSEKTKVGWKELKNSKRQLEQERDTLRKELEELKKQPQSTQNSDEIEATKQELEKYRSRINEYEQQLAFVDVTKTEEYRTNIEQPLKNIENRLQRYAERFELNFDSIIQAAVNPDFIERNAALAELMVGMDFHNQMEFKKAIDEASVLTERAKKIRDNATLSMRYIESQRKEKEAKELQHQEKIRSEATKETWDAISKVLPKEITADQKRMAKLIEDVNSADVRTADPTTQAYAAMSGVLLPYYKEALEAALKENAELKSGRARYAKASPKAKSGSISPKADEGDRSFMDGLDDLLS